MSSVLAKQMTTASRRIRQKPAAQTIKRMTPLAARNNHDIKIVEVGPRDGLQNEPQNVSRKDKIKLVTLLADAGCSFIEAGAFVSKKWVPNMADSLEVMEGLREWKTQQFATTIIANDNKEATVDNHPFSSSLQWPVLSCLTPNARGLDLAVQARADEIAIFGSASEEFSQRNINCSIEESLERFAEVAEQANQRKLPVRGYVSCVLVR